MPLFAVAVLALFAIPMQQAAANPITSPVAVGPSHLSGLIQQQEPSQPPVPAQPASPASNTQIAGPTITVPPGTRIQLALTSPITSKNARQGQTVRAATVFPVTVGSQMAIPVGTYLEGVIDKVKGRDAYGRPGVEIHFASLIFANGYTVPINGAASPISQNRGGPLDPNPQVLAASASGVLRFTEWATIPMASFAQPIPAAQIQQIQQPTPPTPPTLPPLKNPGPPAGVIAGVAGGVAAALIITAIALHGRTTTVYYHSGWQFEIGLSEPVTLDANSVAAAAAMQ